METIIKLELPVNELLELWKKEVEKYTPRTLENAEKYKEFDEAYQRLIDSQPPEGE